jgi:erythromycin esterase-like protein
MSSILNKLLYKGIPALLCILLNGTVLRAQAKPWTHIATGDSTYAALFRGAKADSIKRLIGNAEIVLLGEPTHGEGDVFLLKTEMVRFLHEAMGFNVLAFESGFIDLNMANAALQQGHSMDSVLRNSVFPIWTGSAQFQPLMEYLAKNSSSFQLAGFDPQLTGTYSADLFTDTLRAFIRHYDKAMADKFNWDSFDEVLSYMSDNFDFPPEQAVGSFEQDCKKLLALLSGIRETDAAKAQQRDFLTQALRSTLALAHSYTNRPARNAETYVASDSNPRDRQMADNILYLQRRFKGSKIICWAANTHIANRADLLHNEELKAYYPIGRLLKPVLKDKLCIIGATACTGSYGSWTEAARPVPTPATHSIEALLLQQHTAAGIIDLKTVTGDSSTSSAIEYTPLRGTWSQVFDLLLYVHTTGPSFPFTKVTAQNAQQNTATRPAQSATQQAATDGVATQFMIADAETGAPIPFASIRSNSGHNTVANAQGICSFRIPEGGQDTVQISCIGYQSRRLPVKHLQGTVLLELQEFNSVTVAAAKPDPVTIMQTAIERIPQNYVQTDFNTNCYVRAQSRNGDTVLSDEEYLVLLYAQNGYGSGGNYAGRVQQANIRKAPQYSSGVFMPLTGSSAWINSADLVKTNPVFDGNQLKRFELKLDSIIYQGQEKIFVIRFKARRSSHRVTGNYYVKAYSGTVYIQASDKAIVRVSASWLRDTAILNRFARQYAGRDRQPGYQVFSNILDQETITVTNLYEPAADGRYMIHYGLMNWDYEGKKLVDNSKVHVTSSLLLLTENPMTGAVVPIDRGTAQYRLATVAANPVFWEHYNRPYLNEHE